MDHWTKTKIVATLGPASNTRPILSAMMDAGMDVARINSSHGSYDFHQQTINIIRELNHAKKSNVAILVDLQGPKLRIGNVENNEVVLKDGQEIVITTEECLGTAEKIYITYPEFPKDVAVGDSVKIDDGKLELRVLETNRKDTVRAIIVNGGLLSSKKGVNLPNTKISLPSLTKKDLEDLDFALSNNVEWIGLSFVRSVTDVIDLKERIKLAKKTTRVIAKIEKPEAIEEIDNIIDMADGVMVARGDLGVELPMEKVPLIQKMIVGKCIKASKPVIIATQMMESMILSPVPTRAEVNDVANAVMDGADAVMLSAETSVGAYPIQCVRAMQKTIAQVEQKTNAPYFKGKRPDENSPTFLSDEILFTAVRISDHLKAAAVVGMTFSGYSAYRLAAYRPKAPIFIFTTNPRLLNTLSLVWGVRGFLYRGFESTDHSIQEVNDSLQKLGYVKPGDLVINTASMPITERSRTNAVKISEIKQL
jgi:pyruvate kinase